MKICGRHFNRALANNKITVGENTVDIHSWEENIGIYRREKDINTNTGEDAINFHLSSKDASVLEKIDVVNIEKKENVLNCSFDKSKFKLMDIIDVQEINPNLSNLVKLNLPIDKYQKAIQFAGDKQLDGVICAPNCIVATNNDIVYRFDIETNIKNTINIPTKISKKLQRNAVYTVSANETVATFQCPGELVYTTLMEGFFEKYVQFNPNPEFEMQIDLSVLKYHLQIASNFNQVVALTFNENKIHIKSLIDGQDPRFYETDISCNTNIASGCVCVATAPFIKCMEVIEEVSDVIKLNDKIFKFTGKNESAILAGYTSPEKMNLVVKGDK